MGVVHVLGVLGLCFDGFFVQCIAKSFAYPPVKQPQLCLLQQWPVCRLRAGIGSNIALLMNGQSVSGEQENSASQYLINLAF